ncbi:MAG: putative holin-like toxin [Oscillospiraceae bacterium]|nr:putative holin-like toxin [Oscillospiraceae bacterium]
MVTYEAMFTFSMVIIAVIALCWKIFKDIFNNRDK